MTMQIVLRPAGSKVDRRQLLENSDYSSRGGVRKVTLGEFAGGTMAECAAVCCCCPCGLVDLLVLAVYKLPAGLCRKALRSKRRRRLLKMGLLPSRKCRCDEDEFHVHSVTPALTIISALESESCPEDSEIVELEKEMMEKFYGGGFWRSFSRRHET